MGGNSHDSQCELFGSFGFFVQFALGIFSFMSLIGKWILNFSQKRL